MEEIGEVVLANTRSAKKRIRQSQRRRVHNRVFRMQARTSVKQARTAVASGDGVASPEAVRSAISQLDKAAAKGVIHRNNAARRKSRLVKRMVAAQKKTQTG
jgi:small subunit ribosomal protein S20